MSKLTQYIEEIRIEDLVRLVSISRSFRNLAFRLKGEYPLAYVIEALKKKILHLGIDVSHFKVYKKVNWVCDDVLRNAARLSTSMNELRRKCNFTPNTPSNFWIKNRMKDLSISTDHFSFKYCKNHRKSKFDIVDDDTLRTLISGCCSWSDLFRKIGYKSWTGVHMEQYSQRVALIGIDTSHFKRKKTNQEVFTVNSTFSGNEIKKRLIRELKWPYVCNECKNVHFIDKDGVCTWMNKPVILQLDHINGIHDDNRIENLQLLCPLCHSQTSTWCGKNSKKSRTVNEWIQKNETYPSSSSL